MMAKVMALTFGFNVETHVVANPHAKLFDNCSREAHRTVHFM
jgi:hypothetical protein